MQKFKFSSAAPDFVLFYNLCTVLAMLNFVMQGVLLSGSLWSLPYEKDAVWARLAIEALALGLGVVPLLILCNAILKYQLRLNDDMINGARAGISEIKASPIRPVQSGLGWPGFQDGRYGANSYPEAESGR